VNVIRWIPGRTKGDEAIVSGGVDKSVRIWKESDGEVNPHSMELIKFALSQILTDHTGSVNCIAVLPEIIATGAADGTVNIYTLSTNQYSLLQTLQIPHFYPLSLSLHSTENGIILAVGGSSAHIHLYISPHDITFSPAAILKGHEDWIRDLTFTSSNGDILLASASQDRYVRLWRITKAQVIQTNDTDALYSP
jgi:elongator complex protein 2